MPAVLGPRVVEVETVLPPHRLARREMKGLLRQVFEGRIPGLDRLLAMVESAAIEERYLAYPVDHLLQPRSLDQTSQDYRKAVLTLAEAAIQGVLQKADWRAASVDFIISVSCTGFMIPSMDAHLLHQLGFRPDVRRMPITELGCAAGAVALSQARDYLLAYPRGRVLIVGAEICSNTFQLDDVSPANLIASLLFGDGAAAAVLACDEAVGPEVVDQRSYHFPQTLGAMGFELKEGGFHLVLDRQLPELVRAKIKGLVQALLKRQSLALGDLRSFVLHPGGRKILDYIQTELALTDEDLDPSREVLRTCGNMSSVTLFFVLDRMLRACRPPAGTWGLMGALGPGFSAELQVIRWN